MFFVERITYNLFQSWGDVSYPAANCIDGSYSTVCKTALGNRDAWILINTGNYLFTRVVVFNTLDASKIRADAVTFTMNIGNNITKQTFISKGSGLDVYTFCAAGLYGNLCEPLCPEGDNCVFISKVSSSDIDAVLDISEVVLYKSNISLANQSLAFSMSSQSLDYPVSACNDGVTTSESKCRTASNDRNAW